MTDPSVSSQAGDLKAPQSIARFPERFPLWVSIVVTLGALLTLTGAVISKVDPTLLTNGNPLTDSTRIYADYTFARDLALAVMLLFLLGVRARRMLAGLMVLIVLIQVFDIADDLLRGAFLLLPVVCVFAIAFLLAAGRLFGQAIWHIETWRN
jgi:asparagine N-glycosylation enzyme membrane subunit Stt3